MASITAQPAVSSAPTTTCPSLTASSPAGALRVLLVSLNMVDDPLPVFPLGVAYLRDATVAAGHEVEVFDCLLLGRGEALDHGIERFAPDVIGLSLRNIDNVRADAAVSYIADLRVLVDRIRARSRATVVIGGAGFSIFPIELLQATGCDYGICGEGEQAFPDLLRRLQVDPHDLDSLPGLVHRDRADGTIRCNPPQPAVAPTAAFDPDPNWVAAYRDRAAIFNVQSQRGCPLHCSYCTYPLIEGRRRRLREYPRVIEELRRWRELGVRYVFLTDSVLNTSVGHLRELGRQLAAARIDIEWGCFLRPNALAVDDLRQLADVGLRHVEFGTDSFADAMLVAYGKSFDFAAIERVSAHAHAIGIHYSHFLILGGPGESEATLDQTVERSRQLPGGVFFAFPGVRVYPRTPLWTRLRQHGHALPEQLLAPHFFIEPGLSADSLTHRVDAWRRADPRWAPLSTPPRFADIARRMRARGIEGPLWEYLPGLPNREVATGN